MSNVANRENQLEEYKRKHKEKLSEVLIKLSSIDKDIDYQQLLNSYHNSGVEYFNEFERTIDEYGLPEYSLTNDIAIRKSEDAINMIDVYFHHWELTRLLVEKLNLNPINPSPTAYSSTQRIIKKYHPELVYELTQKFKDNSLPTFGFDSKAIHSGFKAINNYRWPVLITGWILIIISILMSVFIQDLNANQYWIMRICMSVGATLLLYEFCEGIIKVKLTFVQKLVISASGGFGLFVILYLINPPIAPQ